METAVLVDSYPLPRGERIRTNLLAGRANGRIVLVRHDADLVHQADLLLIVARQRLAGGVDVWEETQNGFRRNRLRQRRGGGCRHGCVVYRFR